LSPAVEQNNELDAVEKPLSKNSSLLQKLGAAVVTLIALWLLFGIPGYLLFYIFFS